MVVGEEMVVKRRPGRPKGSGVGKKKTKRKYTKRANVEAAEVSEVKSNKKGATLTASDICDIIKTCKENNVYSFQYNELNVSFGSYQVTDQLQSESDVKSSRRLINKRIGSLERLRGGQSVSEIKEEADIAEQELEFLKINDPEAYEEYMQTPEQDR